ncbi:MAG: hypothetical protein IPP40_12280 [bacterium]|nr:hypothetical protein [bacterium]MBL0062228.1 hypothetical protein [bacterium]
MEQPVFSWRSFDRMSQVLQSVGYVVIVFGTIAGLLIATMGESLVRLAGIFTVALSILLGLYHVSFSMLMAAMHNMIRRLDGEKTQEE